MQPIRRAGEFCARFADFSWRELDMGRQLCDNHKGLFGLLLFSQIGSWSQQLRSCSA